MLGLILPGANAQVLFIENYDSASTPNGTSALAWSGGTIANTSVIYTDGVGVGATRGVLFANDFQAQWNGYMAYQYQNGVVSGNTSPNLSDYTLSFDLNVIGPSGFNAIQLGLHGWLNNWFSGPDTSSGAGAIPVSATTGWQHVAVSLGDTSIWASNGYNPLNATMQLQFQLNGWQLAGGGPAIGEQVVLDNLTLTMVPEPSQRALAGLGAAAFLFRRRNS